MQLNPPHLTLPVVRKITSECQACDLWKKGTQTVFGEGAVKSPIMIGEQPGNEEDLSGHPFVGPAGKLLDWALEEAGLDRSEAYVTNVMKHFKWEPRGKRCILALVVLLGATAAQALLGKSFRVTQQRGILLNVQFAPKAMATVHPSSILRAAGDEARRLETLRFITDLRVAADYLKQA